MKTKPLTLGHEDTKHFRYKNTVVHLVVLQNGADRPCRGAHRGIQHVNVFRLTDSHNSAALVMCEYAKFRIESYS